MGGITLTMFLLLSRILFVVQYARGQFPPPREGITTVKSQHHDGVSISYKEPGICETTPGVRSYSGYLHLPPKSLTETGEDQNYPINTFFWFFESRKDPHEAPLSIWLNGGPGGSSLTGLLAENGPCFVNADSNSTVLNEWSWNNEVNLLYIDQPVQTGYSYDTLHNGTKQLIVIQGLDVDPPRSIMLEDFSDGNIPPQNSSFLVGTFSSQNDTLTANSTRHAAVALWHFAQTWFEEFPEYKPRDEKISLWTESYGGHYGPSFMDFFSHQNERIGNGTISGPGVHYIHLDTLGIVNGCIDEKYQTPSLVTMAYNNTYGIQGINATTYQRMLYEPNRSGGFVERIEQCQKMARELDPHGYGNVDEVNQFCANTTNEAMAMILYEYMISGEHGFFDITHRRADSFPDMYGLGFLNQQWVQRALGVPVNHSTPSPTVRSGFDATGDFMRGGHLTKLAHLLNAGVKVALMYGDRDFACNWIGGEAASLAVPYQHLDAFTSAGYEPLTTSSDTAPFVPYGLVRQHGNFSFTRAYQAGHMVPSYQPEAAYQIFMRALFNRDIATGEVDLAKTGGWVGYEGDQIFATTGPRDTWWRKNEIMPAPESKCYLFALETCELEEASAVLNGTAIVKDWIVVGMQGTEDFAGESNAHGAQKSLNQWVV